MPDALKLVARRLRSDQTSAERKLWTALRRHGVEGFRFRRQVALFGFIVDFASYEARLVVEVDGATHSTESEVARGARRDEILQANGNSVLRFTNDEVFHNIDGILETIRLKLRELRPRDDAEIPCPLVGEG
jgi:very-short-patch-repair endonuclease